MPRPPSSEPLVRCDLNLYAADVEFLKKTIGTGWTTYIREVIKLEVAKLPRKRTLGDVIDER